MTGRDHTALQRLAVTLLPVLLLLLPAGARGQWVDARFPRAGKLQVGFGAEVTDVDGRFGPNGDLQPFLEAFGLPIDTGLAPELGATNSRVDSLFAALELPEPEALTLGTLRFDVLSEHSRFPLNVTWSVTDWLALTGTIPFVLGKAFVGPVLDSPGAGPTNTAFGGSPDVFFSDLDGTIAELESMIAADTLIADRRSRAEALLEEARTLETGLSGFRDLPYTPTDSGPVGQTLRDRYGEVADGFQEFDLELPELRLAAAEEADSLTGRITEGGFGIEAPETRDSGIRLGDIEVGLGLQPLNTFRLRSDRAPPRVRLRARVDAVWRFASGTPPAANRIFDPGTGDGQPDLEFRSAVDLAVGNRFWISVFGGYTIQFAADTERLFTSPSRPIREGAFVAPVHWDPGDFSWYGAAPRFNLTSVITLSGYFARTSRGADEVRSLSPIPDGAPFTARDVTPGTEYHSSILGFALRYSSTGWAGNRQPGLPVEVEFRYRRTVSGGDGFAPEERRWDVALRWYPR